jgi:hypothetical protein
MMTGSSASEFQIDKRKPLPARTDTARVAPNLGDLSGCRTLWLAGARRAVGDILAMRRN